MIIPKPCTYRENGEIKILPEICVDEKLTFCKKAFLRMVKKLYGLSMTDGNSGIEVKFDTSLSGEEYRIDGKTAFAGTPEGAKNALSSILQLLRTEDEELFIKDTKILDKPDKDFRGFMVDLARQFHDFSVLISYVDLCYLTKLKYLQLHFTDNQGITYPFKSFPEAATQGKCYTDAELDYLVEYAHEASVELIPEYEGIGHSEELIKKCPEAFGNRFDEAVTKEAALSSFADNDGKIKDDIMCVGKKDIFNNINVMLSELAERFKYSKYIHIGCDEAKHEKWKACPDCREFMAKTGISDTKKMYSMFVGRIAQAVLNLGKTPIVWEGFPKDGNKFIPRETVVVSWENYYQTADELLDGGFNIINASWKPMYMLPPKHTNLNWTVVGEDYNIYYWQHFIEFSKSYNGLHTEDKYKDRILGGMMCQWECSYEEEREKIIENLPMAADRTWNESDFYSSDEIKSGIACIMELEGRIY